MPPPPPWLGGGDHLCPYGRKLIGSLVPVHSRSVRSNTYAFLDPSLKLVALRISSLEGPFDHLRSSTAVLNQGSQVGKQDENSASKLDKAEYLEPAAWIPANDNESQHQHSDS